MIQQGKCKKRWMLRALSGVVAMGLATATLSGCATSVIAPQSSDQPAVEREDPTVVDGADAAVVQVEELAWWAKDSYVHYGLTITNPNDDLAATDTQIHIVLYDENGDVICEEDDNIALIGPGETVGFAGEAGNGWTPTDVEITVDTDSTVWIEAGDWEDPFTVVSYEEEDKLYYRYEVSGQLCNNTDDYVSAVRLCILMRDETGAIVAGYTGEAYRIKSGQTKDFLLTMNTAPDHASVEVWAQPMEE